MHFLKYFIYLFLERGEGREKERERNINVWLPLAHPLLRTQACALTENRTGDPLVCSLALNPLSHTSQGSFLCYVTCIQSSLLAQVNYLPQYWVLLQKEKLACDRDEGVLVKQ